MHVCARYSSGADAGDGDDGDSAAKDGEDNDRHWSQQWTNRTDGPQPFPPLGRGGHMLFTRENDHSRMITKC